MTQPHRFISLSELSEGKTLRGITFQKPFELVVQIQGESWHQGDAIAGSLTAKNRGSEPVTLDDVGLSLVIGGLRKVKHLSPKSAEAVLPDDAFKLIENAELGAFGVRLGAGEERSFPWSFNLDRNCPVTDASKSLFIVYGRGRELAKLAHLELTVKPFPVIETFLDTLKTSFRFVTKTTRFAKGGLVEVKLAPPAAKNFSALEHLIVSFHMEEDRLAVKYTFNVKKAVASPVAVEPVKKKLETEQSFERIQYTLASGRIHTEIFENGIREALAQLETK